MENRETYLGQSMDDIVFESRNKAYGAFILRGAYAKNMLKALGISCSLFVFSLYTPKMAKSIGLFSDEPEEQLDTTTITLAPPPSIKKDETPPPPPPPEPIVERPTAKFMEMKAVEKDKAEDPPPTIEELEDKDIGKKDVEGKKTDDPPPIDPPPGGEGEDNKVYTNVDQEAEFIGGDAAFYAFLDDNLVYPAGPKANEIEGVSTIVFVVTQTGAIEDVRVERTSGNDEMDAEAVRVIRKCSKRYKPAKNNGKPVKSIFRIGITFQLEEE
jgi:protein TonB